MTACRSPRTLEAAALQLARGADRERRNSHGRTISDRSTWAFCRVASEIRAGSIPRRSARTRPAPDWELIRPTVRGILKDAEGFRRPGTWARGKAPSFAFGVKAARPEGRSPSTCAEEGSAEQWSVATSADFFAGVAGEKNRRQSTGGPGGEAHRNKKLEAAENWLNSSWRAPEPSTTDTSLPSWRHDHSPTSIWRQSYRLGDTAVVGRARVWAAIAHLCSIRWDPSGNWVEDPVRRWV